MRTKKNVRQLNCYQFDFKRLKPSLEHSLWIITVNAEQWRRVVRICHAFIQKQMGFFHQRYEYVFLFVARIKEKWFHLLFTKRTISPFHNWFSYFLVSNAILWVLAPNQMVSCHSIICHIPNTASPQICVRATPQMPLFPFEPASSAMSLMDSRSCCHRGEVVSLWRAAETRLVCNRLLCYVLTAHTQTYSEIKF